MLSNFCGEDHECSRKFLFAGMLLFPIPPLFRSHLSLPLPPHHSSLPLPSSSHPSIPLPTTAPFPSPPLEVGPLKSSYEVWGSAVSYPSGVWDRAPAEIEFGAF